MKICLYVSTFLILLFTSCKDGSSGQNLELATNTKTNLMKENFNRFIDDGWNKKDMAAFRNISVKEFVRNLNGIRIAEHQNEMEANMNIYFTGFPDAIVTTDDVVTSNNRLFAHWTFSGTNTGIFGDSPPTGKKVKITGCSTLQFNEEGKMISEDTYYNELEMLQQLGYTLKPPVLE